MFVRTHDGSMPFLLKFYVNMAYHGNFYRPTPLGEKPKHVVYQAFPIPEPGTGDENYRQYKIFQNLVDQNDCKKVADFLKSHGYPTPADTTKLPLVIAIDHDNKEMVDLLLQHTTIDEYFQHPKKDDCLEGYAPLLVALKKSLETGNATIIETLAEAIQKINDTQRQLSFFQERTIDGTTCLFYALQNYHLLHDERTLLFLEKMQYQALINPTTDVKRNYFVKYLLNRQLDSRALEFLEEDEELLQAQPELQSRILLRAVAQTY